MLIELLLLKLLLCSPSLAGARCSGAHHRCSLCVAKVAVLFGQRSRQLLALSLCCYCSRTKTTWSPNCSPVGDSASEGGSLVVFARPPELTIVVDCLFSRLQWPEIRTEKKPNKGWAVDFERRGGEWRIWRIWIFCIRWEIKGLKLGPLIKSDAGMRFTLGVW